MHSFVPLQPVADMKLRRWQPDFKRLPHHNEVRIFMCRLPHRSTRDCQEVQILARQE